MLSNLIPLGTSQPTGIAFERGLTGYKCNNQGGGCARLINIAVATVVHLAAVAVLGWFCGPCTRVAKFLLFLLHIFILRLSFSMDHNGPQRKVGILVEKKGRKRVERKGRKRVERKGRKCVGRRSISPANLVSDTGTGGIGPLQS
jgi:hypothetical protein